MIVLPPPPALTHLGVGEGFPERPAQPPEESGEFVHAGGGGDVDAADDLDELRKTGERMQKYYEEDHTHTHTRKPPSTKQTMQSEPPSTTQCDV